MERYVDVARRAAERGGEVIQGWAGRFRVAEKGRADLVTDADVEAQAAIAEEIRREFPGHEILGEEGRLTGEAERKGEGRQERKGERECQVRWIVDPLDGTTNYVHGVPLYCVSIGVEVEGRLRAGVIYDPTAQECFWAGEGMGAWLGSERLRVSQVSELGRALVATGFPPGVGREHLQVEYFIRVMSAAQSVRRIGSAALSLAYVAAGRFDAFWNTSLNPWDAAAGVVLIREAGGRVTRIDGSEYDLYRPEIVATNGAVHEGLVACLAGAGG